jgi:hypothetical protein
LLQLGKLGKRGVSAGALVLLFACVASAGPIRPKGIAAARGQGEGVEPTAGIATGQKLFDFRSGFWLNLHHFLFLQAVLATPDARKGHAESAAQDAGAAPQISPDQKATWGKAVRFYMQYGKRDPLTDHELLLVNYELSDAGNSSSLAGRRLPTGMEAVLEEAAPVYRDHWWAEHDRKNREWAMAASKLIREYGAPIAQRIAVAFQAEWPREETTAEVVIYANWAGAYTATNSTLITISSSDPAGQSEAALETLFHEASHALVDNFQKQLDAHLRAVGKTATFALTHAIIFYTAGTLTVESLAKNNIRDYSPYAIKNGMYERVKDWKHYKEICDNDWLPYLDGKTTFDAALTQMAKDF